MARTMTPHVFFARRRLVKSAEKSIIFRLQLTLSLGTSPDTDLIIMKGNTERTAAEVTTTQKVASVICLDQHHYCFKNESTLYVYVSRLLPTVD